MDLTIKNYFFLGKFPFGVFKTATIQEVIETLSKAEWIAVDTETYGFNPCEDKLVSYQLSDGHNSYFIVNDYYPITLFKELLETKNQIYHNAQFDLKFLYQNDINPWKVKLYDTFLAECLLTSGLFRPELGLGKVAFKYLGYELSKSERGWIRSVEFDKLDNTIIDSKKHIANAVINYGLNDVSDLHKIKKLQEKLLEEKELTYVANEIEFEVVKPIAYSAWKGQLLDVESWGKEANSAIDRVTQLEIELDKEVIRINPKRRFENYVEHVITRSKAIVKKKKHFQPDLFGERKSTRLTAIEWASSQQVVNYLKEEFNITVLDKASKPTSDSKFVEIYLKKLERLNEEHPSDHNNNVVSVLKLLLDYRESAKLVSTYGLSFLKNYLFSDGRIRSSYWQIRDTGRCSSGSSEDNEGGDKKKQKAPNVQNLPPKLRYCFIADPDYVYLTCDYKSQEPRVTADRSKDEVLLDFINNGDGDMHSFVASKMYSKILGKEVTISSSSPYVEVNNKRINARQIAKAINLGIDYGKTAYTVKEDLLCTEKEAQRFIDDIKSIFPKKFKYFAWKFKQTIKLGYILVNDLSKRKRFIEDIELFTGLHSQFENKTLDSKDYRSYIRTRGEIERICMNTPIQGTAADITKLAEVKIWQHINEHNLPAYICNRVHDELDIQCHISIKDTFMKDVARIMEETAALFCKSVTIPADITVDTKWMK
jgi:DNA polymerase I-like protein with 3'-5' exonuclease and polymerase domains